MEKKDIEIERQKWLNMIPEKYGITPEELEAERAKK